MRLGRQGGRHGRTSPTCASPPTRPARASSIATPTTHLCRSVPADAGGGMPAMAVCDRAGWSCVVLNRKPRAWPATKTGRCREGSRVAGTAEAHQIVEWYCRRWIIEQVFPFVEVARHGHRGLADGGGGLPHQAGGDTAVLAMQVVLARDGTTGQPVTDAVEPSDMAVLRELNTGLQGAAPRSCGTRSMRPRLRGTPGSPHGWAGGQATPRADTSRRGRRPCTAA